ncbi:MAG: iron-containing alcohol dehydrogenase [Promethearchaeota archaeon]
MSKRGDVAWYEDPNLKGLYIKASSQAMRDYHAPFTTPKTTFIGSNSLIDMINYLGSYLDESEKRVIIIVDQDLRKMGEYVAERLKTMKSIDSTIFDEVLPEAPKSSVIKGVEACKEYDPKIMIAIGGGSAMDTAKMIMLLYEKPNLNLNMVMTPTYAGIRKKIYYLIAIPTTSGTGSEATYNAVLSDTDRDPPKKTSVPLYELCPDFVVLHVDFVKTMPPGLAMGTGMDALAHAAGAYMLTASNELTDIHNEKAIEMILKYLPRSIKRSDDLGARSKMQLAAYIAGVGFINTASAGIEHSLGHSFGGVFHAHHGIAVGIFLPNSIAYQSKITQRFKRLAKLFGVKIKGKDDERILNELLQRLIDFMKSINAPICIKDLESPKVSKEDMDKNMDLLVDYAWNDIVTLGSSRKLDKPQIRKIYEVAYENKIEDLIGLYKM